MQDGVGSGLGAGDRGELRLPEAGRAPLDGARGQEATGGGLVFSFLPLLTKFPERGERRVSLGNSLKTFLNGIFEMG